MGPPSKIIIKIEVSRIIGNKINNKKIEIKISKTLVNIYLLLFDSNKTVSVSQHKFFIN